MFEIRTNAVRKIERQKRIIEAVADRKSGMTTKQIAEKMGVSTNTIVTYFREERLSVSSGIKLVNAKIKFNRNCLCCRAKISVTSPWLRLCEACRTNARGAMV